MNVIPYQPGLPVPSTLEQAMAPEWLSQALATEAHGAAVSSVVTLDVNKTFATEVRFAVTFAGDANRHAYCLKGLFGSGNTGGLARSAFVGEADFYCKVAPVVEIRVPECVSAVIDRDAVQSIVIMRDLIDKGASFCSALEPFSPDEAAASLAELARLHQHSGLLDQADWIRPRASDLVHLMRESSDTLQDRLDGQRSSNLPGDLRDASRLAAAMAELAARVSSRPAFMLHGDAHAGNIFRTTSGPGFSDWQLFQRGGWALDVAYHLIAVLPSRVAATEERRLLDEYLAAMRAAGRVMPDGEEAWRQYREAAIYGFCLWTATPRSDQPVMPQFVERLGKAVARLDSLALLGIS